MTSTGNGWNELPKRHSTRQQNTETHSIHKQEQIEFQDQLQKNSKEKTLGILYMVNRNSTTIAFSVRYT